MRGRARAWLAAGLLVASLLGGLLLSELVLRVVRPQAVGVSRLPTIYQPDLELGYRYRAGARGRLVRLFEVDNTVSTNAWGLPGEQGPPDEQDRVIAVLGDSFTAALQVPEPERWPCLLQEELRAREDPRLRVLNLGLDGTGPDVQLELLRDHLRLLRPELALVAFFENDAIDVRRERLYREVYRGYVLQYQSESQARAMRLLADREREDALGWWLFEHFYLYRLGLYLWSGDRNLFRTNVVSPSHVGGTLRARPAGTNSLQQIFQGFVALARERGFALAVVAVPGRDEPERSLELLRRGVKIPGLRVLDPLPGMRERLAGSGRSWRDLYWPRDGHFNVYGNRVFAEALAGSLAGGVAEPWSSRAAPEAAAAGADPRSSKSKRPRWKTR